MTYQLNIQALYHVMLIKTGTVKHGIWGIVGLSRNIKVDNGFNVLL